MAAPWLAWCLLATLTSQALAIAYVTTPVAGTGFAPGGFPASVPSGLNGAVALNTALLSSGSTRLSLDPSAPALYASFVQNFMMMMSSSVVKFVPAGPGMTGAFSASNVGTSASFTSINDISADGSGNVFLIDRSPGMLPMIPGSSTLKMIAAGSGTVSSITSEFNVNYQTVLTARADAVDRWRHQRHAHARL